MAAAERRALVIINRKGSRGKQPFDEGLAVLRRGGIEATVIPVRAPQYIPDLILANIAGHDLVVVGGGDGTLSSVADTMLMVRRPLGILPMGNANDLARTLGIPATLSEACAVIADGHLREVDLGCVNGRHFFNVASIGLSVLIADRLTGEVKRRWGVLGYIGCAWEAARTASSFTAHVTCDGEREEMHAIQIAVGNGRHYGGGMTVVEDAAIDDGRLDLYAIQPRKWWRLILLFPALRWGTHRQVADIHSRHGTVIRVETTRRMKVNVDGEVVTTTPAEFHVVPRALPVLVPGEGG
jgi:YegS/Rv2252/BmrU family lipid kinase